MNNLDYIDDAIKHLRVERPNNLKVNVVEETDEARVALMKQRAYLRKKYRLALKYSALMDMHVFAETHPEWGAKDVLVEIMKDYFSDFPSVIVLEMAEYIVTEWDKIQASKNELAFT